MSTTHDPSQLVDPTGSGNTAAPTVSVSAHQNQLRRSSNSAIFSGLLLIVLFFVPFINLLSMGISGLEFFVRSWQIQSGFNLFRGGTYVIGLSVVLFPIAGLIGVLAGTQAHRNLSVGKSIRGQGSYVLLAALATGWPIFELGRMLFRLGALNPDLWQHRGFWETFPLHIGAIGSIIAALGLLSAGLRMRKEPNKPT